MQWRENCVVPAGIPASDLPVIKDCQQLRGEVHDYFKLQTRHFPSSAEEINTNTVCPTTYQTRQFFNNFTTNEDIAKQLGALHTPSSSFLTYEHAPVQISLQYLHWFWNY
jgi:hypothetical protein